MIDDAFIDIVPVDSLHQRLGVDTPLDYPAESLRKPFVNWRMEVDDAPIFRYLYRSVRPKRHLEFGTWEGTGVCMCAEECDATVWTINLPEGETIGGRPAYSSAPNEVPSGASALKRGGDGRSVYQTDAGVFIGHRYRSAGFGHRVCQILCDSREWDTSGYPSDFFDSALIDGGHSPDVVLSDTQKALAVVRPGGLILWHDFCPDPAVFPAMASVTGVVGSLTREWRSISRSLSDAFWIRPSFILAAVR
jgi:predicted O-methyltransferase YrrM